MKTVPHLILLTISAFLFSSQAFAQEPRVVDLGSTSFTNAVWYDVNTDVAWVGGFNDATDIATMWSIDEMDTVTPNSLAAINPGGEGAVSSISRNGAYVGGATESQVSQPYEGTVWVFGQWGNPQNTGFLPGIMNSEVRAISNNGIATGTSSGGLPFRKDLQETIILLPALPGAIANGVADGISAAGDVFVGGAIDVTLTIAATKWRNIEGGIVAEALDDPGHLYSQAGSVSPDGSLIGGLATDAQGGWTCAWINDSVHYILDDEGERFFGIVTGVTNDGLFVGGGVFNDIQKAFVWHMSWPNAMTLEDWLIQNGELNPPILKDVRDVFHDGEKYHFAVEGAISSYYVQTNDVDQSCSSSDNSGDIDCDGDLDLDDALALVAVLLESPLDPQHIERSDLNNDARNDGLDIQAFVDAITP